MITAKELELCKAQAQFQKMCEFLRQAADEGQRLDQVERGLFPQAMEMCLRMLQAFVEAHGDGDVGPELEHAGRTVQRLEQSHDKRYLSIFGELLIPVTCTARGKAKLMNGCHWMRLWAFQPATILTCWKTGCSVCA